MCVITKKNSEIITLVEKEKENSSETRKQVLASFYRNRGTHEKNRLSSQALFLCCFFPCPREKRIKVFLEIRRIESITRLLGRNGVFNGGRNEENEKTVRLP